MKDLKEVPKEWVKGIPEYIKDYLGERLWGNKRRKSMPLADFDGRRRTLVLVPEEEI